MRRPSSAPQPFWNRSWATASLRWICLASVIWAPAVSLAAPARGILLEFSASWCGPCRQMAPTVDKLKRNGWPIRAIDVDQEPQLARRFNVSSIPAFVLVVDGKVVDRVVGATSEESLVRLMRKIPKDDGSLIVDSDRGRSGEALPRSDQETPETSPDEELVAFGEEDPWTAHEPEPQPERTPAPRGNARSRGTPIRMVAAGDGSSREATIHSEREPEEDSVPPVVNPLLASVRLRVKDEQGTTFGSGTVIDSRSGRSIVVSCNHVFANLDENSLIHVDVFRGDKYDSYVGRLVARDEEADLGLVAIPTLKPLAIARVGGTSARPATDDELVSVGCSGGDVPTHEQISVRALDRYAGPENIECTGIPDQGRSGGGLFNRRGDLVGVCSLSDSKNQCGLYSGLKPVHALLDRVKLSHLYQNENSPSDTAREDSLVAESDAGEESPDDRSRNAQQQAENLLSTALAASNGTPAVTTGSQSMEALEQIFRESPEAEVICVVRPLDDSKAASRIVILNRASSEFVAYLLDEYDSQTSRRPVSMRVPEDSLPPEAIDLPETGEQKPPRPRANEKPERPEPDLWGHSAPQAEPREPIHDDASAFGSPIRYRRTRS